MKRIKKFLGMRFEAMEFAPSALSGAAFLLALIACGMSYVNSVHADAALQSANECTQSMDAMTTWAEAATKALERDTKAICKTFGAMGLKWPHVCE